MPRYEFKCPKCGSVIHDSPTITECRLCGSPVKRKFSFSIGRSFQAGYNPFVGQYVSSARQYKDIVKKGSDDASEQTGIEHDYQLVDFHDKEALGIKQENLDAQFKHHRDNDIPWT